jgi:type I restriction enzyme S subunit
MAGEWRDTTIGALCDSGRADLQTGPFGSQLHAYDYVDDGVPVVPTEAVRSRRIDHSVLPKVSPSKATELSRHRLQPGDILFARRGIQATGHVGVVRAAEDGFLCGTGAIRLRVNGDSDDVDPDFLSHVLADPASVEWFKFHAIGATMPNLNEGIIRAFPLVLPPRSEQRAIAHILGTLDDKINLNRRMSETLEAMARALFKSWFVNFDPVRAKTDGRDPGLPNRISALFPDRLIDSESRCAPEGWPVVPLPELISVNPQRRLRKGEVAPYLDMGNMPTQTHAPGTELPLRAFGSGMRFMNGDTLVARITPCLENGKTAFVDFLAPGEIAWGSTEYIVLRPKAPLPEEFAYCLARSDLFRDFAIQSMTGSSGRQRVRADSLDHFLLAAPPAPVAEAFGQFARPLFARAAAAVRESRTLAALRDTLLPKLISGELRVKTAERLAVQAGV